MADLNDTPPKTDLLTPPWDDATALDQVPEEHRARVAAEREDAAAQAERDQASAAANAEADGGAAAATKPAKTGSGDKTKARRDAAASAKAARPATGARPRRARAEAEDARAPVELVGVVLKTSRFVNPATGRNVARRTVVKAPIARALQMILQDLAREATPDETATAVITLD